MKIGEVRTTLGQGAEVRIFHYLLIILILKNNNKHTLEVLRGPQGTGDLSKRGS